MICIHYSPEPYQELDLSGSNGDLSNLRDQILGLENKELVVALDHHADLSPYDHALSQLRIAIADSLLNIHVVESELRIYGREELLRLFAESLPWDGAHHNESVRYHHHFDRIWYEKDVFTEDSLEIVLSLKR